jgi:hypothetical protein
MSYRVAALWEETNDTMKLGPLVTGAAEGMS